MNTTLLIIVLLLGVLLLTLEIVALPGGIAGAFGILLIGFGVWQTYGTFGTTTGTIVLLCSIALIVLLLVLFMKKKTWRGTMHETWSDKGEWRKKNDKEIIIKIKDK